MNGLDAHFQASVVHNGDATTALLPAENDILGDSEAYTLVDFSFGFEREKWSAELFIDNVFDERVSLYRYSECDVSICSNPTEQGIVYGVVTRPRMVGLKFSQRF